MPGSFRARPPISRVASGLARLTGPEPRISIGPRSSPPASWPRSKHWMPRPPGLGKLANDRIAVVERNILRLGIHELRRGEVPPKVAIDEAVHLAHWFGDAPCARLRERHPRWGRPLARAGCDGRTLPMS